MSTLEDRSLFFREEAIRTWYREAYAAKAAFHRAVSFPLGSEQYEYWMAQLFKHISDGALAAQEVVTSHAS